MSTYTNVMSIELLEMLHTSLRELASGKIECNLCSKLINTKLMILLEFSMLMMTTMVTSGRWSMWVWSGDIIHHGFMITMVIFIMEGAIFIKEVLAVIVRGRKRNR